MGIKGSRLVNEEEEKNHRTWLQSVDNALLLPATDRAEERALRSFDGGLRNTLHTSTKCFHTEEQSHSVSTLKTL